MCGQHSRCQKAADWLRAVQHFPWQLLKNIGEKKYRKFVALLHGPCFCCITFAEISLNRGTRPLHFAAPRATVIVYVQN